MTLAQKSRLANEARETEAGPHSKSAESVLRQLGVDPARGLSSGDAEAKRAVSGPNALESQLTPPAWYAFLAQFSSVVVWLLAAAAFVSAITGSVVEAIAIVTVLILNAVIGFAIEWQSNRALETLRRESLTVARVRREGKEQTIEAADLVIGDIVVLNSGDRVPADARLIDAVSLRTDESTLTGESMPVEKSVEPVADSTPLAERQSMAFLGTNVVAGHGSAVVTATGKDTEIGRVGLLLEQASDRKTPLERRLADLGKRLVYLVLGISLVVLLAGVIRGDDLWLVTKISISLAVAAVPEGLPAVTTLILALGVLRMARASAIVRHLAAVETLGSATVICTDKTGTLTENRMKVRQIFLSDGRTVDLSAPLVEDVDDDEAVRRLLEVAVLCNEAVFRRDEKESLGDPTETALLVMADRLGVDVAHERGLYRKVFELPFDASHKKMIAVFDIGNGEQRALMKGAPAVVLAESEHYLDANGTTPPISPDLLDRFRQINEKMARTGLRVLAFADKTDVASLPMIETGGHYTFLGFVGMTDPPRPEVPDAIRRAQDAGIRVVMLTGDQPLTAEAVAVELHLGNGREIAVLHSSDLTDANESRLGELARYTHVFARVTPEDKLRIVRALQKTGEVVAVTGDGVNDAPALKQADIGVAMGLRGTDVAKESADVVLTDDNFSTIVRAVEGGRTIYANIIKFVHLMFSHNLGEILVIFVAILAGLPLPLLPLQILWINLVTDIFPAFALAVEPSTEETMHRRPRSPAQSFLSGRFMFLIAWQGTMLAAIALAAFVWALGEYGEGSHARTVALFALVAVQLGHLLNCRSRTRSVFDNFFSNPFIFAAIAIVVGLQVLASFTPILSQLLDLDALNSNDLIVIGLASIVPVMIVEVSKVLSRRFKGA